MKFDNSEIVKNIFKQMEDFITSITSEEEKLNKELEHQNNIQTDLLHEIELADLNAIELMKVAKDLRKVRKERRKVKNELKLIERLKPFYKRYTEKGFISETTQAIINIDNHEEWKKNKQYTPRVLENLKCVRKEDK